MAKLLIVESPGKLKTLRKILGRDWILEASVGHTTELAHDGPKRLGFEMKDGRIKTRYIPRGTRGKQVLAKLREAIKKADQVYLATDPDREGEAIAWHLCEQLGELLRHKRFVRVSYTQITESAVKAAIANPRTLDLPLIEAQRARQCMDKLVGYEVSPLLWNSTGGRSAGRVQSATLHLICERERARLAFKSEDYWTLQAKYFESLSARYEPAPNRLLEESGRVKSEVEAKQIAQTAKTAPHQIHKITKREENRTPPPPLITSSLQQAAGMRFRYPPQKTMKIAQELYEGVGGKGLITYMRTDAITLSPEFVQEARSWLQKNAPDALADRAPIFKTRADAQGAHEAIRPTSVELTPEKAQAILNREQLGVYTLIWERAVASQCRPARLSRTEVEIHAGPTRWIARGMQVLAPGYLRFWRNIHDETELPLLKEGQVLRLDTIEIKKNKTEPPSRYSEPKVVQLMEKLGIGRPSTYASTIMTLKEREYVTSEKGLLAPTTLGMATDEALGKAIPELVDAKFTAEMEASLDRIAEGSLDWEKYLCGWNEGYLRPALTQARVALTGVSRVAPKEPSGSAKQFKRFAKPQQRFRKKARSRSKSSSKVVAPMDSPPQCTNGHGALQSRLSKKGAPYWKCGRSGCESWAWPGKSKSR
ncbi:MAG: type I DNA topoisomerase [Bdellovibrionia bacterium]